jgi:iron complex transport system ATP-binding protein
VERKEVSSAITVQNLCLQYNDVKVLHDLTFTVEPDDFFIIIGPNGAGKTSLLKMFFRTNRKSSGSIFLFGRELENFTRKQLSQIVAVVPQNEFVEFPFTVAETVLMGRSPHLSLMGLEKKEDLEIAEEAMRYTETSHLARRRLDQLSGGERQRVIIARAICQQPQIILLDEPTTALDPFHQLKIMDLMERLRKEKGTTIIMVSHDLNLAAMYGNSLLFLKDGAIQKHGVPSEVLTEEELSKGYGCRMLVDTHPAGDAVRVNLLPEKYCGTLN